MKPVEIEVISPMLTAIEFHCAKCSIVMDQVETGKKYRDSCRDEYPEEWKQHADKLAEYLRNLSRLYKHRILIRMIDAHSPVGLWKQIRHRVFQFPAFIVDGKQTFTGWDSAILESLIDRRIQESG
jgi:hypothetical protein